MENQASLRLQVPKLKDEPFRSMVVFRYRRCEESVDEALIDMKRTLQSA